MRRTRAVGHATLLGMLAWGAVSGIVMLGGSAATLVAGETPVVGFAQVMLAALMVLLWGSATVAGVAALCRQCRHGIGLAVWVTDHRVAAASRVVSAAARVGCPVIQVDDTTPFAFTFGVWRPRVVVSAGLVGAATFDELVAVLWHEDFHRRHRDPLRVLMVRTWSAVFFFVPLVRVLLQRLLDRQELRADRVAVRACGVAPVAGALFKATGAPEQAAGTALAAMGGPALLAARVTQLETGRRPVSRTSMRSAAVLTSLPGLALIVGYGLLMLEVCMGLRSCCG